MLLKTYHLTLFNETYLIKSNAANAYIDSPKTRNCDELKVCWDHRFALDTNKGTVFKAH